MIKTPWEDGSPLDREIHGELIRDAAMYARLAGIRPEWLWQPLSVHVGPEEISWVKAYRMLRDQGTRGLIYVGDAADVNDRMQAMVGALIRNFIDARIRPISQAITRIGPIEESPPAACSVLFLPDLCTMPDALPGWFVRETISLFMEREAAGKQTVCYVRDLDMLRAVYGDTLYELLSDADRYPRLGVAE